MTETTTLTVYQQMKNRLGTADPMRAILALTDRIEALEKGNKVKLTAAERMAKARAARGRKNEQTAES